MMRFLILTLTLASLTAKAQVPMTTDNRSLGPGTYEEAVSNNPPPSDGYKKGWQSSRPSISYGGTTGSIPLPNPQTDVPEE